MWHKLACIEPPAGLLQEVQSVVVDFFRDKFHWVSQSVLFLPKEEGEYGLVHFSSRSAAFRVQFIQHYLTGTDDVIWRNLTSIILRKAASLELDASLFRWILGMFAWIDYLCFIGGSSEHGIYLNRDVWRLQLPFSGLWKNL